MKLIPLPAFDDNYIWMLHDGNRALVVDPGDAQPVLQALQNEGVQLQGILVTHHHADHTGGVDALRNLTGAAVFGPASERMPEPLRRLNGGDSVPLLGLDFKVLDVPGHTAGHIAYAGEGFVFCGDTLFAGSIGRTDLGGGSMVDLLASCRRLLTLDGQTQVLPGHGPTSTIEEERSNPFLI